MASVTSRAHEAAVKLEMMYVRNSRPPTIRELAVVMGLKSTATTKTHLDDAVAAGLINHKPGRSPAYYPLPERMGCTPMCPTARFLRSEHPDVWIEMLKQEKP